jgi:hypothetical protein
VPGGDGAAVAEDPRRGGGFPQRDNTGVLWLQKRAAEGGEENLLDVTVHRKIFDRSRWW